MSLDAFPSPGVVLVGLDGESRQQGAYAGMSLRDYFAAKAMQVMLVPAMSALKPGHAGETITGETITDTVCEAAYQAADAMLKARQA